MAKAIPRNLPSEDMVIALINRDNDLYLSRGDVIVGNIRNNPTPTQIETTGLYRDTVATLQAVYGGSFKEHTDITYRRLDAGVIFGKTVAVVPPNGQSNTYDLLPSLNEQYGLALQKSDIFNEIIDLRVLPVEVTIRFRPECPAWKGSIPVVIRRVPIDIDTVVDNPELPILRYPTGQTALIQGDLYAYSRNFNSYADTLVDIDINSPLDPLVSILNKVFTPDVWVIQTTSKPFNLYNAVVLYNGPVTAPYSDRRSFNRVLVIGLDKLCNNMAGRLILHYNA